MCSFKWGCGACRMGNVLVLLNFWDAASIQCKCRKLSTPSQGGTANANGCMAEEELSGT